MRSLRLIDRQFTVKMSHFSDPELNIMVPTYEVIVATEWGHPCGTLTTAPDGEKRPPNTCNPYHCVWHTVKPVSVQPSGCCVNRSPSRWGEGAWSGQRSEGCYFPLVIPISGKHPPALSWSSENIGWGPCLLKLQIHLLDFLSIYLLECKWAQVTLF